MYNPFASCQLRMRPHYGVALLESGQSLSITFDHSCDKPFVRKRIRMVERYVYTLMIHNTRMLHSQEKSRAWCFTINNPSEDDKSILLNPSEKVRYRIVGEEVGSEGTSHLQGYFVFHQDTRFSAVKKLLTRAHIEKCEGSPAQNREYCSKDNKLLV